MGTVHHNEICNGDNVDAESALHFAILGVAPPGAAEYALASSSLP